MLLLGDKNTDVKNKCKWNIKYLKFNNFQTSYGMIYLHERNITLAENILFND